MEKTQIIPASSENLIDLQKISQITFVESFGDQNTAEDMDKYLHEKFNQEQLLLELQHPESEFHLVYHADEVIGYLKLNWGNAQTEMKESMGMEIERIYVLKKWIGKGIGKALYGLSLRIAASKGMSYIWLGVWEKNERALTFYQKNGFKAFDQHVFVLGDDHQTDILMKLELKACH